MQKPHEAEVLSGDLGEITSQIIIQKSTINNTNMTMVVEWWLWCQTATGVGSGSISWASKQEK